MVRHSGPGPPSKHASLSSSSRSSSGIDSRPSSLVWRGSKHRVKSSSGWLNFRTYRRHDVRRARGGGIGVRDDWMVQWRIRQRTPGDKNVVEVILMKLTLLPSITWRDFMDFLSIFTNGNAKRCMSEQVECTAPVSNPQEQGQHYGETTAVPTTSHSSTVPPMPRPK